MSARSRKPRNPAPLRGTDKASRVEIAKEEDTMKVEREETKENADAWGIRIPSSFDPTPVIALRTSVKQEEPSDGHVKHEDKKPVNVNMKPEDTKQGRAKRETNLILSPARLWEHGTDGEPYVPRPTPMSLRNKLEDHDVVDPADYLEPSPHRESSPLSPPPPSPPPQHQPLPQHQAWRHYHDDRAMPEVEVVLPRWEDVRRAEIQARRASLVPTAANARQTPGQGPIVIKPEPDDDDVKPLLALEEHDPAEARDVLRTAVQNLQNPVAKVKKELLLDDEFLLDALTWEGINYKYPVPLPPHISEFQFKREYIGHLYGGNHQETFPRPRKEMLEQHGLDDWAFLSLDFNPHAPTKPGHSGLFFSSRRATWAGFKDKILRTFVRVASGKWVYMGQYKMEASMSLTAEHWKQQKQAVRQAWAEGILDAGWGWETCVRIWLRKQRGPDYRINKRDVNGGWANIAHIRAHLTEEDIMTAYDRGEEEMGTYRMTCVGYEAEFVDVLVRNVPRWVIFDGEMKEMKAKRRQLKGKGKGKRKQASKETEKGTGSKRKPIEINSDSESDGEEQEGGDGDVKMEINAVSGDLPPSSTSRPRRAAATVKRQRTG